MAYVAASRPGRAELPPEWDRLERAAEDAAHAVSFWKRRALEAEDELVRLRGTLEELAGDGVRPADVREEVKRLRAENTALRSRMAQARKRVTTLLKRVAALEVEP